MRAARCRTRPRPERAALEEGAVTTETLPAELVDRVRDRVFTAATQGDLTDEERDRIIGELNVLAQYGDIASRWALLRNYHQSAAVRRVVGPGDITRYGLDLIVTRPEQAEKVDFEFIFTVSAMYQDGTSAAFGEAFIDAVRDDGRLQDPLTLGGVMQQVLFAPGGCEAILAAAAKVGPRRPGRRRVRRTRANGIDRPREGGRAGRGRGGDPGGGGGDAPRDGCRGELMRRTRVRHRMVVALSGPSPVDMAVGKRFRFASGRPPMMLVRNYIDKSPIHGVGVFAGEFIPKGTCIWELTPDATRSIRTRCSRR